MMCAVRRMGIYLAHASGYYPLTALATNLSVKVVMIASEIKHKIFLCEVILQTAAEVY